MIANVRGFRLQAAKDSGAGRADIDYAALYAKGITFAEFLENARARRDEWRQHYNDAAVTPDLVTRMRALPGATDPRVAGGLVLGLGQHRSVRRAGWSTAHPERLDLQ